MAERTLPIGTVTFLFSDMEGSTRLVQDVGSAVFAQVLERHQQILRAAFAKHDGVERGTQGDSFLAVFREAPAAIAAAAEAQIGLATAEWPKAIRVRVRMGVHTGAVRRGGDDYVGVDINRAARIASAAHGGQVLISDATRGLVADDLPEGVRVEPLGSYRLKDLAGAERLHQLQIRGLPSAFPPLRALDVRHAHLPPESTTFIGRTVEMAALADLLTGRRLITLTGPGGTGKTRLALRTAANVAGRFEDGAFFTSISTISEANLIPAAIAATLNLPEDPARSLADVLTEWLRERNVLLVLDNLEQVEAAGGVVDDLLSSAPRLSVLATSRSPLQISGEQEFPVPPLSVPSHGADAAALEASDAVQLFVERARLVRPDLSPTLDELAVIADISARLDGLPLGIELAAARARFLPLPAIRDRLGHRLDALVGGPSNAPRRQQSLRATIAWSNDLLDDSGRATFRRLATFVGGWTIEAAEAVCGGPPVGRVENALESLAAQSLIQSSPVADEPRFTMLPTIGEFAFEQLETSDEAGATRSRHRAYFRQLAERARAESEGPGGARWFDRLEVDLDNIRTAIEGAVIDNDLGSALAIAGALEQFWLERNHSAEGRRLLATLIERPNVPTGQEFAAAAAAAARMDTWLGDYAMARRMGELGVAAYRRLGDRRGLAYTVGALGFAMIELDAEVALAVLDESLDLFRDLGDARGEARSLLVRATAQFRLGHLREARASVERSLELAREAGDYYFVIFSSSLLGRTQLLTGDIAAGIGTYRSMLEEARAINLRIGIANGLENFGEVAIWAGDVRQAVRLGAAAQRLKQELGGGIPLGIVGALEPLVVGRRDLAPAEFDREAAAGRAMDLDSAVAEALAIEPPVVIPSAVGQPLRHVQ
jgi:predicted ATPase/class 3 adenylate cyclase